MDFKSLKKAPLIGRPLTRAYALFLRAKNKKYIQSNASLRDTEKGKRCFIVATGPSIKNENLAGLAGELVISVSNFFLHPDWHTIKPKYHLFAASHPPITAEQYGKLFLDAEKVCFEGQNILVSLSDRPIVESHGVFKKQNVIYYSLGHKELSPKTREIDLATDLPAIQTSVHIALYAALYMGAGPFYLLGVDHDWILHMGKSQHFYDQKEAPMVTAGYNEWQGIDFGKELAAQANLWRIYKEIKAYAGARGTEIWNATKGSLLDVFPPVRLEDILKK